MQISDRVSALRILAVCFVFITLTSRADAAAKPNKKVLDHTSYERWNRISQTSISNDGQWVLYTTQPGKGTPVVKLLQIKTGKQYILERSRNPKFSFDGKYLVYLSSPKPDPVKQAVAAVKKLLPKASTKTKTAPAKTTTAKATPAKKPATKYALEIFELATGRKVTIDGVKSFAMPSKAADRVAYLLEKTDQETIEKPGQSTIREVEQIGKSKKKKDQPADQRKRKRSKTAPSKSSSGGTLAVRNLATGVEARFPDVTSYRFPFSEN